MTNPYSPPEAPVDDIGPPRRPTWLRTAFLVAAFSSVCLFLAWLIVPPISASLAQMLGVDSKGAPTEFLVIDLVLSCLTFVGGCYLAARLSRGHVYFAALGVGAAGFLFYIWEVGGLQGMMDSDFPFWYDFFPSHAVAALVAAYLAKRRESTGS